MDSYLRPAVYEVFFESNHVVSCKKKNIYFCYFFQNYYLYLKNEIIFELHWLIISTRNDKYFNVPYLKLYM